MKKYIITLFFVVITFFGFTKTVMADGGSGFIGGMIFGSILDGHVDEIKKLERQNLVLKERLKIVDPNYCPPEDIDPEVLKTRIQNEKDIKFLNEHEKELEILRKILGIVLIISILFLIIYELKSHIEENKKFLKKIKKI